MDTSRSDSYSVSQASVLSDTISSIPSNQDDYDADPFASPRLQAIFGAGIVVVEDRITGKTVDSQPHVFVDTIIKDHKEVEEQPSSSSTQRNFLERSAIQKTKFTMFSTNFNSDRVSVIDQIQKSMVKGHKEVTFSGARFTLPAIRDRHLTSISQGLSVYADSLLQTISVNYSVANKEINHEATKKNILRMTQPTTNYLTSNVGRRQVYNLLLSVLVLEDLAWQAQSKFFELLQTHSIIHNNGDGGGAFIRLDSAADTITSRLTSMINQSSMQSAIAICYNLKLNQIRNLISYLFDKDILIRTEAKINLLSSVSPDIRNDIAMSPNRVLIRSFSEHYLTRSEILSLMFNVSTSTRSDAGKRCPHCYIVCNLSTDSVLHGPCPVTDWLVTNCQFEYHGPSLVAPSLGYINQGLANYAQQLLTLEAQRRLKPYISRTEENFKIITLDAEGTTRVVAQHGSKPVRIVNEGYSNSTGSSFKKY